MKEIQFKPGTKYSAFCRKHNSNNVNDYKIICNNNYSNNDNMYHTHKQEVHRVYGTMRHWKNKYVNCVCNSDILSQSASADQNYTYLKLY